MLKNIRKQLHQWRNVGKICNETEQICAYTHVTCTKLITALQSRIESQTTKKSIKQFLKNEHVIVKVFLIDEI